MLWVALLFKLNILFSFLFYCKLNRIPNMSSVGQQSGQLQKKSSSSQLKLCNSSFLLHRRTFLLNCYRPLLSYWVQNLLDLIDIALKLSWRNLVQQLALHFHVLKSYVFVELWKEVELYDEGYYEFSGFGINYFESAPEMFFAFSGQSGDHCVFFDFS